MGMLCYHPSCTLQVIPFTNFRAKCSISPLEWPARKQHSLRLNVYIYFQIVNRQRSYTMVIWPSYIYRFEAWMLRTASYSFQTSRHYFPAMYFPVTGFFYEHALSLRMWYVWSTREFAWCVLRKNQNEPWITFFQRARFSEAGSFFTFYFIFFFN